MAEYRVKWEIDVDADTAREAAQAVRDTYFKADIGLATVFTVTFESEDTPGKQYTMDFDFSENDDNS